MSSRNRSGLVAFALLAFAGSAPALENSPTLLFDTPTADVLEAGRFAVSASVTGPLTNSPANVPWWEADANIRFSPVKRLDFALTAFTLKDYVLDAKYQLAGGEPEDFGLAVGVYDIGIHSYVSPIGNGPDAAWPDWRYYDSSNTYIRPYENFSAYAVASIPLASYLRAHLGLGRGRFVGYDGPNEFLNSDILSAEYHKWIAVALFGGVEVFVTPNVALVLEANTRDLNTGVKADFGPVSAAVAWKKMEGLLWAYEKRRFGRIELGATYKFGPVTRKPKPEAPAWPQELPPPPPAETTPPIPEVLRLYPIWFMWDKWDITEVAAATLRRNADVILSHPEIKSVTLLGYASEEGTLEHNLPLSGRRANAALEYLKSLGVPAEKMTTRAMGESPGRPYPLHRAVYFEIEK